MREPSCLTRFFTTHLAVDAVRQGFDANWFLDLDISMNYLVDTMVLLPLYRRDAYTIRNTKLNGGALVLLS